MALSAYAYVRYWHGCVPTRYGICPVLTSGMVLPGGGVNERVWQRGGGKRRSRDCYPPTRSLCHARLCCYACRAQSLAYGALAMLLPADDVSELRFAPDDDGKIPVLA
eukprot:2837660-Rhodomonas_salina.1